MAKPLRYISIGLGVALIILGWFVIDSEPVQREAAADVGGLVASRFVDDPGRLFSAPAAATPSAPDALNWRTIIGRAAATTYAAGIACMIFGAGLIGLGVPARGGGRDESMPPPADARPGLLMLGAAGLLLLFGVILAALNGFEGVGSLFGGRSALILAGCGLATLLLRPVRILGLAAYYAGLAAAGLIGLNLARLASRAVLATFLFEDTTFILTASALGMLILFLLIWRAIPGGLNRARLMDQFRRLAAGAGAAAIIAGICIFKSSVLPQQAAADLTDSHHDSGLAGAVLATALEEHGRTAPRALSADEPHPRRAKDEAAPAPADERERENQTGEVAGTQAGRTQDGDPAVASAASSPPGPTEETTPPQTGTAASTPMTPAALAELVRSLPPAELQKLLNSAGVDVDVNDRRVRQKIDAYCARFPFDDPEVIRIINAFVDAADEEGAAMPTAAAPTAPAAQDKGTVGDVQGLAPPESVREVIEELERRGRPPIPSGPPAVTSPAKRQSTRIVAPKVNTRIAPEQVAATPASPLWRTPDRTAPSLPDAMPLAIPSESPAARDISRQLENARRQSQQLPIAMTTPPVPGIIGSADWSTAAAHASTNDIDDDGAETQDAAGATPDERGEAGDHPSAASASPTPTAPTPPSPAATAVPPPPPPDISSITELTGLEALIGRTTLAADRIGLLAIVIGSATLLASLVLRGFRLTGTEQRCADS